MATPTPAPFTAPSVPTRPASAASAPVVAVVSAMCDVTTALAATARTSGSSARRFSWPAGTSSTAPRRRRFFSVSGWRVSTRLIVASSPSTITSTVLRLPARISSFRSAERRARRPWPGGHAGAATTKATKMARRRLVIGASLSGGMAGTDC